MDRSFDAVKLAVDARERFALIELGYVVGAYDDGLPKFRFGFTAEVRVDGGLRYGEDRPAEVTVNMGAIGSHGADDAQARVDVYQAAVTVARSLEQFLADGGSVEDVDGFLTRDADLFEVVC
jgi:hypothetical protein